MSETDTLWSESGNDSHWGYYLGLEESDTSPQEDDDSNNVWGLSKKPFFYVAYCSFTIKLLYRRISDFFYISNS